MVERLDALTFTGVGFTLRTFPFKIPVLLISGYMNDGLRRTDLLNTSYNTASSLPTMVTSKLPSGSGVLWKLLKSLPESFL